jgi:hypothetical protein
LVGVLLGLEELDELELLELEGLVAVDVEVLGVTTELGGGDDLAGVGAALGVTTGLGGGVVCRLWYFLGTAMLRGVGVTVGVVVLVCTFTGGAGRVPDPSKVPGAFCLTSFISWPTLLFSIFFWASVPLLWAWAEV